MKKKLMLLLTSLLTFIILATGCSDDTSQTNKSDSLITVTTTIGQIADIVENVGGEYVEVTPLMGPGIDPHLFQASQGDIKKLSEADIIFYNGLHLEGKMNEIFEKMRAEKPTYAVSETVPEDMLLAKPGDTKAIDPHVWFDTDLWAYSVKAVSEGLAQLDPEHADIYHANAEKYIDTLKEIRAYAEEQLAQIPEESRVLVTAHDAFGYFGDAYGIEVMGLQGLSTDSEYGLKDVQNLVDLLVDRKIKAVFIESSISEKSINAVVEGAKEQEHEVIIGGSLYSDAMGEQGTEEGTYEGMYMHNIDTIVSALK
ncbi:metal ABC transporter solute-binding protein, Zn/Mn family [Cytobacillus sp. IB215316]|uniref:metal ABC transporter solute-binding protein, Zn/Mn family n=1 Tax=Cytobacillus sp. IB215316 TaxID=3097354 RepID=UPI002A118CC6|nr:zinc ABC transporter substrate-binding protein [Cytobacillus sp. IB215316]MDX8360304.1 zinc ABC transporter substrate-binding protein [Cytobacillus sp. IB215316]